MNKKGTGKINPTNFNATRIKDGIILYSINCEVLFFYEFQSFIWEANVAEGLATVYLSNPSPNIQLISTVYHGLK